MAEPRIEAEGLAKRYRDGTVAVRDLSFSVRAGEVDGDRVALWAFSGGGMLLGRWLADSPAWLCCVALSYPLLRGPQPPAGPRV